MYNIYTHTHMTQPSKHMNIIISHIKPTLLRISSCQIDELMFKMQPQVGSSPKMNFVNEMVRDESKKRKGRGRCLQLYINGM
jgi:predicted transcriptional regulator